VTAESGLGRAARAGRPRPVGTFCDAAYEQMYDSQLRSTANDSLLHQAHQYHPGQGWALWDHGASPKGNPSCGAKNVHHVVAGAEDERLEPDSSRRHSLQPAHVSGLWATTQIDRSTSYVMRRNRISLGAMLGS
ncbi:hypothetical protein E4U54_000599, partial [Claviceps lovelessii]